MTANHKSSAPLIVGLSIIGILFELVALAWWRGRELPPVLIQNSIYLLTCILLAISGVLLARRFQGLLAYKSRVLMLVVITTWLLNAVLFVRLASVLVAAARLGSS